MRFNRREFIKGSGLGALALAAGCGRGESLKPNIIFILADDLGIGDLGCYGQTRIVTSNVDRLAQEGKRFSDCYAGSPVCAPSRSVLMTGQHTGHTRVRDNFARVGGIEVTDNGPLQRRIPLAPEDVTVAQVLKGAGYATGITGKWGLSEPGSTGEPNAKGFDEWFGYLNQRRAHTYYPEYLWRNGEKEILDGNLDGAQGEYSHDLFTGFALDFIRRHNQEPFFLFLPYTIPHYALQVPDLGPYETEPWDDPDLKRYAAMVTRLDRDVGRIMALLRELGIDERTIVFFCSDNGGMGSKEAKFFNSTGPFRGHKGLLYEGGLRIPMIARWPGRIEAGTLSGLPWMFADVLPTLAELAGAPVPANVDGVSVSPELLGRGSMDRDRFLYWEFHSPRFKQAVRWGKWKAVRQGTDQPLELYDLSADIGEQRDVAGQHPEIVARILDYLRSARSESENWPVASG